MLCTFLFTFLLGAALGPTLNGQFLSEPLSTFGDDPFGRYSGNDNYVNQPEVVNGEFEVPLDHFSPTDGRVVRLSFQSNVVHFEMNGPIFININDMTGNRWLTTGLAYDLAQDLGGAIVTSDYRFTDRNIPHGINVTEEHLKFTTVDHLLADIAHLVTQIRYNLDSPESKVVLFGSRLGGTLYVLARKKYPHLVDGAWSSGGIFRAIVPEYSYLNTTATNIFRHGSLQCARTLSYVIHYLTQLAGNASKSVENRTRLRQLFNLCDSVDFAHPMDGVTFIERIFFFITIFVDTRHYNGIRELCTDINRGSDPVDAFARWVNYVYLTDGRCRDISHRFEISRRRSSYLYRAHSFCTQLGINLFKTTPDTPERMFPDILTESFQEARCREVFPDIFNRTLLGRAVTNFNIHHGDQNQVVTNAMFSYGELDPFIEHGITQYDVPSSGTAATPLYSVEADMSSLSEYDSARLRATKLKILRALRRFVEPEE